MPCGVYPKFENYDFRYEYTHKKKIRRLVQVIHTRVPTFHFTIQSLYIGIHESTKTNNTL